MKYLLDTHTFLWVAVAPEKLSAAALGAIETPDTELFLSAASLWEIGILQSLDRIELTLSIREVADLAASELGADLVGIEPQHVDRMSALPFHHRDPFDRMLIAQALDLHAAILSKDAAFDPYGVVRLW
ncbi:MAG TPA: type II toxin-antitoxin system VapC family toxin [Terriglobia bacterium]|nr:type II toxin-antitoxin system VapC family toxin [Terriglobia bacterium]